jgi:hypothetical protein
MMWSATTKIGCGTAPGPRYQITSCRYSPPGNFDGQLPYPDAETLQVAAVSSVPAPDTTAAAPVTADSVPLTAVEQAAPTTENGVPSAAEVPAPTETGDVSRTTAPPG